MYRLILGCSMHSAYFLISYHPFTLTSADFLLPSVSLILIILTVKSHLEVPLKSCQFKGRVKRFDQSSLHNMIKHPKADKRTRDSVTGGEYFTKGLSCKFIADCSEPLQNWYMRKMGVGTSSARCRKYIFVSVLYSKIKTRLLELSLKKLVEYLHT